MARIRTIKPEFWTSEQVMNLSPNARLLFIGLWNFCDDAGIHPASLKRLKAEVMPADDVRSDDVRRMIDECIGEGLIREYEIDGDAYWAVTGWHHQKIDQPSYKYPMEDGTVPEGPAKRRQASKKSKDERHVFAERSPPEGKGREGKVEDKSSLRSDSSSAPPADPPDGLKLVSPNPESKAERLAAVTKDAIETFNAASFTKAHGGVVPNVSPTVGVDKRRQQVARCVKTAREICREQFGQPVVTREFWEAYWTEVAADDFLSGRQAGGPGHENWRPDFEYLTRPATMLKVYERAAAA